MSTRWASNPRPGRSGFTRSTARAILRKFPLCQLRYPGCTEISTQADHVVGWQDATAMGWTDEAIDDQANGQGACVFCHGRKSQAEAKRGKQRQQRRQARGTRPHPGLRQLRPPLTPPPPPPVL